ncbi:MAG: sigma-70 family RNA polymerase sigma factor [Planctomycetales bacterium]|nr:sigma-70 family RNA polymerase sigma factor [Planctomycetales bacterium]
MNDHRGDVGCVAAWANKSSSMDDLAAAMRGDRDALARLLCEHGSRLAARIGRRLQMNPFVEFSADDVLQEVFIDAFRGFGSFDPQRGVSLACWLDKIADNRLAMMFRERGRQKRGGGVARTCQDPLLSSARALVAVLTDSADGTASQNLARNELVQAVQVGVAALPDDQRVAIQSRYLDERSLESTADAMGRTVPAVRGLLHRAKKSLHDVLRGTVTWMDGESIT